MKQTRHRAVIALSVCALLGSGCASTQSTAPEPEYSLMSCAQLDQEISHSEAQKRVAGENRDNAWKVVMPLAVAARYSRASADIQNADRRITELGGLRIRKSCATAGNYN